MSSLRVLLQIAFRNLFASFLNVIVGFIILIGTFLVLVGGGLLDSMDRAMTQTITGSVTGQIQVYSDKSKDTLDVFTDLGGDPDIRPLPDFSQVRDVVAAVPNVKTVIPMGIRQALLTSGNTIDTTLERLRASVNQKIAGNSSDALKAQIQSQKEHVRLIVSYLADDLAMAKTVLAQNAVDPEWAIVVQKAQSEAFWNQFDSDPLQSLEFLENKIAPLSTDADLVPLRYMGTDLTRFREAFPGMKIRIGQMVPEGQRGFLFGKFVYEELFKLKAARRLDKIHSALKDGGKTIALTPELSRYIKMNQGQTKEIVLQLDRLKTETAIARLQKALNADDPQLTPLLVKLFDMNDANFFERYDIFYKDLAPLLELYRIKIGDMLPIKTFTRSGYVESVNVKVYGTFEFAGLEESPLAGAISLMDMVTFRDLYGYANPARLAEIQALKAAAGIKEVSRESAEAELFGGSESLVGESTLTQIDENAHLSVEAKDERRKRNEAQTFTQNDIDKGMFLNAAVILKDPKAAATTLAAIEKAGKAANLPLRVVSWDKAAGLVGQMIMVAKLVLYLAVAIIFIVALVIINNAMMMATLQRVKEIGTMRAVGAQRSFVLSMILTETVTLGVVFGAIGGAIGAGVMALLHQKGIPAPNEQLYLFFAGPRLFPSIHTGNVVAAFVIVLLVSAISTLYPAFIATRVSPIEAMQAEE